MSELVPFNADPAGRSVLARRPGLVLAGRTEIDLDATLGLIARAAETMRMLQREGATAEARATACLEQIRRDRAEWRNILQNIDRELTGWRQRATTAEMLVAEAEVSVRALVLRCEEAEARERRALERAEAAEDALARVQETLIAEFSRTVAQPAVVQPPIQL